VLPFLKNKQKEAAVSTPITINRKSDKPKENQVYDMAIRACAEHMITEIQANDADGVADAMRSAFEILETLPHEEIPHSYENQKED